MADNDTASPRYAADITAEDVESLLAFVHQQIEDVGARYDTPAWSIAASLQSVVDKMGSLLRVRLPLTEDNSSRGINRAFDIQQDWNLLMTAVHYWRDARGYDAVRWVYLNHATASAEETFKSMNAKRAAKDAAAAATDA